MTIFDLYRDEILYDLVAKKSKRYIYGKMQKKYNLDLCYDSFIYFCKTRLGSTFIKKRNRKNIDILCKWTKKNIRWAYFLNLV